MAEWVGGREGARPVAIDLFAGVGGLGLGMEQAGFDVVAALEYDPVHAATHAFNLPDTEVLCRDASKVDASQLMAAAARGFSRLYPGAAWDGKVDAVVGGPPCQGFSTGGKREAGDLRNDLLLHFVRLVEEIRPATICLENVAGLLESRFAPTREVAFERLEAAGYRLSGTTSVVDAHEFGVPQRRRRVIVLGALGDEAPGRPIPVADRPTVRQALDGLPNPSHYPELLSTDVVALSDLDMRAAAAASSKYARRLAGLDIDPTDLARLRAHNPGVLTSSRRTVHRASTTERFAATPPGSVEPVSRFYRLPLDGPSRTLRAGTGAERGAHTSPRPIHPLQPRVITAREAGRLHGFPDWFRFHTTNWHAHRQIGNSVPPPLALAAGRSLIEALGATPARPPGQYQGADELLLMMNRTSASTVIETVAEQLPKTRQRLPSIAQ